MAIATTEKPRVKKSDQTEKAPRAKKEPVEKVVKEKPPKIDPAFSVEDLWAIGREYATAARAGLKDFQEALAEKQALIDADPRTYRDHVTAAKFLERRNSRIGLSLTELEAGLKERKPRAVKDPSERKPRAKKVTEEIDEDVDDLVDDEDEDDDTDLDDDLD